MYKHILVPTDGSRVSAHAEETAVQLAKSLDARITAVHVLLPYPGRALGEIRSVGVETPSAAEYRASVEKRGKAVLRRVTARASRAGVAAESELVYDESTSNALERTASRRGCDLIVVASNGRTGIERLFVGSVTSKLLRGTRTPVLVCR